MTLRAPFLPSTRPTGWGGRVSWLQRVHAAPWLLALVFALLWSLMLSPLLSRMHQVAHPGHGLAAMATVAAQATQVQEALAPAERSVFERLFGQHAEGSPACQLLDHSGAADGPLPQADALQLDLPTFAWLGPLHAACVGGPVAFFQARGPPALL